MSQRESIGQAHPAAAQSESAPARGGWAIVDADGLTVARNLPNRATAVRRLGHFAVPPHPLPLHVVGPTGQPSGDTIG